MTEPPVFRKPVTVFEQQMARRCAQGHVMVIDDDGEILSALAALLELEGYACTTYSSALAYMEAHHHSTPRFPGPECVLCDVNMPEISGLELQSRLSASAMNDTPLVLMSGVSGARETASAFRAGALDFLIKPMDADVLLAAVNKALAVSSARQQQQLRASQLAAAIATLTERERAVVRMVAEGRTNQAIADEMGIALRTTKLHRQHAMEKLSVDSVPHLVRLVDEAGL